MSEIDWEAEKRRFERVAFPLAIRAEFMAKLWDQWSRLLMRSKDPEPLLWPLLHWAKQWVYMDRRLSGRPRNLDLQDYRAGMKQHLMDGRGNLQPHDRADRINGFLDWTGKAHTDDPGELASALEQCGMTLEEYCTD